MRYEKPAMEIVALRSSRNVADTCWGFAANGGSGAPTYYYEFSNSSWGSQNGLGTGTWIGFKVNGGGKCKDVNSVKFFAVEYGPTIEGNSELEAKALNDLVAALTSENLWGNGGSNFGIEGTGFSTTKGNSW